MPLVPLLLSLVSAALYASSFPPVSCSFLAWVALSPFFIACVNVSPRPAAVLGLAWGVAAAYGVGWWFPDMVSTYLKISTLGGWIAFFTMSLFFAGVYFSVFAAWVSWVAQRQTVSPFIVAAGWGAGEFVRASLFFGDPWALAGYSQVSFTRLMQIADATGPYGVGILIAAVNACAAGLLAPTLRGRWPALSCAVVGVVVVAVMIYGERRLSQTFTEGEPVSVVIVQGAIEREARWSPKHAGENLERYLALTRKAVDVHPRLIFWPEYAVNFYLQQESPLSDTVFRVSRDLQADIILGGPHFSYGETAMLLHNSIFLVRDGKLTGRYDKAHLLPLAEANHLQWLLSGIPTNYEPGNHFHTLRAKAARVGAFVCFEAMYPELVRRFVEAGAEVLANPSNDDWFGAAAPARHHFDMASVRAIENRRYLIRVTTNGYSGVIDPYGRVVILSGFDAPEVLTATIFLSRAHTPYQRWGDAAAWSAIGLVFLASLIRTEV